MKLFGTYLKYRIRTVVYFVLVCAVFTVSFMLYGLPVLAVIYPSALCAAVGVIFAVMDFLRIKRIHESLCRAQQLTADVLNGLPDAEDLLQEDYLGIIERLKSEISELASAADLRYRDMTEYYTVWVHQIKTPISSMRLTLQNEDTPLARKLSSDLFRIEQYVDMVLAFLRLESVSSDYVFSKHSLDVIVKGAAKKFASEFIDRRIRLEYTPINLDITTDEKWLSLVIEQLISNALKYTREGSVRIYMRDGNTLCIEDTGIGIAPEDLPRIFEKGYTGCNGRIESHSSGIGLYLCRRICKNLGMGISVQSELDKGTAVLIDVSQYKINAE